MKTDRQVLVVDEPGKLQRLAQRIRTVAASDQAKPAPVNLQIKPMANGKLRLSIDHPVVEFDRNAALDIARTIKKLAMALPVVLARGDGHGDLSTGAREPIPQADDVPVRNKVEAHDG